MMNRVFVVLLLSVFQLGFAQTIQEKALLWEISGKNLTSPSYLFGTIHIACQGEVEMRPEIQKAWDATEQLVLEIDMDDPAMIMKLMQASLSKDGQTISEKLGEELSDQLNVLLEERMEASLSQFDNLNLPTFLAQMSLLGLDCPMDFGYDLLLMQTAMQGQKEVLGLESIEAQIEVLLGGSDEDSVKAIRYFVEHFDELKQQTAAIMAMYQAQDIEQLYAATVADFTDPNHSYGNIEDFLDNRNINWIPVIEKKIQQKPSFIAFGAAHLAGKNGVINLLKKAGYTLTPIFSE